MTKKTDTIHFYGAMWCSDCRRSKQFLDKHNIKYEFHNTDEDQQAEELVKKINKGIRSIPTIVFPDGIILVEPSNKKLAEKIKDQI